MGTRLRTICMTVGVLAMVSPELLARSPANGRILQRLDKGAPEIRQITNDREIHKALPLDLGGAPALSHAEEDGTLFFRPRGFYLDTTVESMEKCGAIDLVERVVKLKQAELINAAEANTSCLLLANRTARFTAFLIAESKSVIDTKAFDDFMKALADEGISGVKFPVQDIETVNVNMMFLADWPKLEAQETEKFRSVYGLMSTLQATFAAIYDGSLRGMQFGIERFYGPEVAQSFVDSSNTIDYARYEFGLGARFKDGTEHVSTWSWAVSNSCLASRSTAPCWGN